MEKTNASKYIYKWISFLVGGKASSMGLGGKLNQANDFFSFICKREDNLHTPLKKGESKGVNSVFIDLLKPLTVQPHQ